MLAKQHGYEQYTNTSSRFANRRNGSRWVCWGSQSQLSIVPAITATAAAPAALLIPVTHTTPPVCGCCWWRCKQTGHCFCCSNQRRLLHARCPPHPCHSHHASSVRVLLVALQANWTLLLLSQPAPTAAHPLPSSSLSLTPHLQCAGAAGGAASKPDIASAVPISAAAAAAAALTAFPAREPSQ
jgi:hypothetical protein